MHYHHNKEESAEILRRALKMMAPHSAGFHPLSYAVWYEHAADLNPGLSRELDKLLCAAALLGESEIARLYGLHIAARDIEAFEQAQGQLRVLLEETASHATCTQTAAARFTDTLEAASKELDQPAALDAAALKRMVRDLLMQAQRLQKVTAEFSQTLAANRAEVDGVIERLERSQTEPLRDPLTGLNNRHGLQRATGALIGEGESASGGLQGMVLLAADIDHFKQINDTHGHVIGDKVLLKVAEILRAHAGPDDIAARLGGDEFVILIPGQSLSAVASIGEQIRTAVARMAIARADGVEYAGQVSLSIGIATGDQEDTLDTLRHRADSAMYKAKDAGRNRVSLAAARAPASEPAA